MRASRLTVFGENILRILGMDRMSGTLVGKRLVAIRSPSTRKSWMASAFSSFCGRMGSFDFLASGVSVWVGDLSVARRLVRSVCKRSAVDFISSRIFSAHSVKRGNGMGN